ncbi:MAG: hypothetical protein CL470_02880 [Acidimicrobiaceae bacterium]|nr:hypothetical protein [Acidimicrobiaceae bacterium]
MTPFKWLMTAVALVSIAFIVILSVQNQQKNLPNFDLVGEVSPEVAGVTTSGNSVDLGKTLQENRSLAPIEQTWTAVNFFASWCSGCIVEHEDLVRFHEQGVTNSDGARCPTQLLGVAFNDDKSGVENFFAQFGGNWPVLVGPETNQIALDFSVLTAPETFLIAPSGVVILKVVGPVTYETLVEGVIC